MNTELVEHKSSSYAPRTYYNATTADLTLAIAVDFNTAGERLTKKAAGDLYLRLNYNTESVLAARELYKYCKLLDVQTLNIAGNGIYTFSAQGIDQGDINKKLYEILSLVHQHYPIKKIISGGQTGMDMAAGVVAEVLGIPCTMTYPKGFKIRGFTGEDVSLPKEQLEGDIMGFVRRLREEVNGD